jgi:hypothetical protein
VPPVAAVNFETTVLFALDVEAPEPFAVFPTLGPPPPEPPGSDTLLRMSSNEPSPEFGSPGP